MVSLQDLSLIQFETYRYCTSEYSIREHAAIILQRWIIMNRFIKRQLMQINIEPLTFMLNYYLGHFNSMTVSMIQYDFSKLEMELSSFYAEDSSTVCYTTKKKMLNSLLQLCFRSDYIGIHTVSDKTLSVPAIWVNVTNYIREK